MNAEAVLARVRAGADAAVAGLPEGASIRVEADDFRNPEVKVRLDLHHLDADALADRLHSWTQRTLASELPEASAFVSFHHALPASAAEEPSLDVEERWLGLHAVYRLSLEGGIDAVRVERFVARLPEFLRIVRASGRPSGWRRHDEGALE